MAKKKKIKKVKKTLYRSAKNGRFVSKKTAKKRPSTTVKETM